MDITEHVAGKAIVLDVRGRLYGLDAGHQLYLTVDRLGQAGWRRIVANLQHVSAIDAGGLGALVAAHRASARNGVSLRLVHATGRTHHLIRITRLSRVLEMFNSLEEALDDEHQATAMAPAAQAIPKWQAGVREHYCL